MDYEAIKALAKQLPGVRVTDLIALAPQNDPFYVGAPGQLEKAHWFADIWQRFGYGRGVHLRRIHYQIVSQDPPLLKPNGTPYENTENDWAFLDLASKYARYLELVPVAHFVDRRNPDALVYARWIDEDALTDPGLSCNDWDSRFFERYAPGLSEMPNLPELPSFSVTGYDQAEQEYLVEVWAEKTTMNDILDPLCRQFGANLVTGAGELSITAVMDFLNRARDAGRPARILYVSDFDPAGLGMPVSVARKVEYYQRKGDFDDLDICLQPIVLTAEQVATFNLPRVPVKDSDRRKANFEVVHGEGQVELDALEALHPGQLRRIVREAATQYIDSQLDNRAFEQKGAVYNAIDEERDAWLEMHGADLEVLERDYGDWREKFSELWRAFLAQPDVAVHVGQLNLIQEQVSELSASLVKRVESAIDLEEYPLPEPELPPPADGLLYDSGRDYLDQLEVYKAHKAGTNGYEA